jgi:poly-gamma-glutamate synthesis protein (capsule biosynthesis protein)
MKTIKVIKSLGFKMVTLANNHIYDYGNDGMRDTLEVCKKYGITTIGAGHNLEQAKNILCLQLDGKRFYFINCCEHEFSIADDINGGANPLNIVSIYWQIQEAKKISDYIIIIVHGGHEHFQLPSPRMKEMYRFFYRCWSRRNNKSPSTLL